MAPLYGCVGQLQQAFCPLSTRAHLNHLPGRQARSVPCTRLSTAFSRQQRVVAAAASEVMANDADSTANGSSVELDRLAGASRGTKAVHGGERAGRPRVSGAHAGRVQPLHAAAARAHAQPPPPAKPITATAACAPLAIAGSCAAAGRSRAC